MSVGSTLKEEIKIYVLISYNTAKTVNDTRIFRSANITFVFFSNFTVSIHINIFNVTRIKFVSTHLLFWNTEFQWTIRLKIVCSEQTFSGKPPKFIHRAPCLSAISTNFRRSLVILVYTILGKSKIPIERCKPVFIKLLVQINRNLHTAIRYFSIVSPRICDKTCLCRNNTTLHKDILTFFTENIYCNIQRVPQTNFQTKIWFSSCFPSQICHTNLAFCNTFIVVLLSCSPPSISAGICF